MSMRNSKLFSQSFSCSVEEYGRKGMWPEKYVAAMVLAGKVHDHKSLGRKIMSATVLAAEVLAAKVLAAKVLAAKVRSPE